MLHRLRLEQYVIVDQAELVFHPGLNVLTGETGAGKSILIDALELLLGGRAQSNSVRAGAARLAVEGEFSLTPAELERARAAGFEVDEEGGLALRREVSREGKSRSLANNRSVLVGDLRRFGAASLRVIRQGAAAGFDDAAAVAEFLDELGGHERERAAYAEAWRAHQAARRAHDEAAAGHADLARDHDWVRFQRDEILEIDPKPGEYERLGLEIHTAKEAQADRELWLEIQARLLDAEGSALDQLETVLHRLRGHRGEQWDELRATLEDARDRLRTLGSRAEAALDSDPGRTEELEQRHRALARLRRKFGDDEARMLARAEELESALRREAELSAALARLSAECEETTRRLLTEGAVLSEARRGTAQSAGPAVEEELQQIGMPDAEIDFAFESSRGAAEAPEVGAPHATEIGLERPALRFRGHRESAFGSLSAIASGGETSRVLLALQAVLGGRGERSTWVFDEIDAGIGGETALRVAGRLAALAERSQVLLVTHQAPIAARAARHFCVHKREGGGRPKVEIEELEGEARLRELARMLSGDETSRIARQHAEALLTAANPGGAGA